MYEEYIARLQAKLTGSGDEELHAAIALMRAAEEIRLLCVEADESGDSRIDTDLIWGKLRKAIEQQ
jgi:hypothetical protein